MLKIFYTLLLCFLLSPFIIKASITGGDDKKSLVVSKLPVDLIIDGKLTESVWNDMPELAFTQRDPDEGKPSTQRQSIKIVYDEHYIYIGARLYDTAPDSIVSRVTRRDNFPNADWFMVFFDPYYDKRSGYYFAITPGGSIVDGTLYNDEWDETTWNAVWDYGVNIDDEGWTVEMKIPFSQLKFKKKESMTWGVNFKRVIARTNEQTYLVMTPKKESGFVSRFADMTGFGEISDVPALEIIPYIVQKGQFLVHDPNDPFYKSNQFKTSFGLDAKYGLSSNLTLDLTVNPDFGQVEVDPAELNLTTFETFFQEKRPFFIEGSNLVSFGNGGANNNWGFNWASINIFYSRRIGRTPIGSTGGGEYVDYPTETPILGAAKVTGKIGDGWSMYALNAYTPTTYAKKWDEGVVSEVEVEPQSNYTVLRSLKEFDNGKAGLGFIGTSTLRLTDYQPLKNRSSEGQFVGGIDGWINLDDDKTYVLTGAVSASLTKGDKNYITSLQRTPLHNYQRPDFTSASLDSSATSLSGYAARFALNKQKGNLYVNTAFGIISPGFDINDLGFQSRTNYANGHIVLGWRDYEPDNLFRNKQFYLSNWKSMTLEGIQEAAGTWFRTSFSLQNYWFVGLSGDINYGGFSSRQTRGGPLAQVPHSYSINFNVESDFRKNFVTSFYFGLNSKDNGSKYAYTELFFEYKPGDQLRISFSPGIEVGNEVLQWVTAKSDPIYTPTYGSRYIFATMEQKTFFASIRADWTFTPTLSLQLFAQPFISSGSYNEFKQLKKGASNDYLLYGTNGSTISYDSNNELYSVNPGDGGAPFTINNPDFNFKSIRLNLILRWEFVPGSTLFLVWTHDRTNFDDPGKFDFGRDFSNLMNSEANNIFLVKLNYWFNAAKLLF